MVLDERRPFGYHARCDAMEGPGHKRIMWCGVRGLVILALNNDRVSEEYRRDSLESASDLG